MLKYISDSDHYIDVLARCSQVKHDLWIGTADLKDLYVEGGRDVVPFLSVLDKLLKRGVDVRLLHAKEPGENFREDFDKYPGLWSRLERRLCPRVHFKIMIFDCATAYIGSANLTGTGVQATHVGVHREVGHRQVRFRHHRLHLYFLYLEHGLITALLFFRLRRCFTVCCVSSNL